MKKKQLNLDDKTIDLDVLAGASGGCHHSCCGGCCGGGAVAVPVQTQTAWAGHWSSTPVVTAGYGGVPVGNASLGATYGQPVAAQPAAPGDGSGWTLPPTTIG